MGYLGGIFNLIKITARIFSYSENVQIISVMRVRKFRFFMFCGPTRFQFQMQLYRKCRRDNAVFLPWPHTKHRPVTPSVSSRSLTHKLQRHLSITAWETNRNSPIFCFIISCIHVGHFRERSEFRFITLKLTAEMAVFGVTEGLLFI